MPANRERIAKHCIFTVMRYLFILLFLLRQSTLQANDTLVMSKLLQRIEALQPRENGVFPQGSIPSYRMYAMNKDRFKADINPFFSALVGFTLRNLEDGLSPSQQRQAARIIANTLPSFAKFINRKGQGTYNFWPTDTPKIFPNAGWMNWFDKKQALPDDLDDTVIILLAQQANDSTAKAIHALMQEHANHTTGKIRNTFPEYRTLKAYSTWFGKRMPIDFDVSVLCNVLYFVQTYNLQWTEADSASLFLIEDVIRTKKYINQPGLVSPHYATTPNILYHISRLMSVKPIPALEALKPQLIDAARQQLRSARTFMDEVILGTALLRWNEVPPQTAPHHARSLEELVEDERFAFFIANMSSLLPDPYRKWIASLKVTRFDYYSPAYNNVLLLEHLVWRSRLKNN